MTQYEIKIRKPSGECTVIARRLSSDFVAVRCARSIADDDDLIEVWRGMDCVYLRYTFENGIAA